MAKSLFELVNINAKDIEAAPAIRVINDSMLEGICSNSLNLQQPCHNQSTEKHVKRVNKASSNVAWFERRN